MMTKCLSLFLFALWMTSAVFAQYVDPQNVLIRNIQLIDRDDDDAKVIVNILIRDNRVEVVTKDEIPLGEVSMAIDGRNGFLLGALVIGEAPEFIILDQDPRENFDVLVNSRPHVDGLFVASLVLDRQHWVSQNDDNRQQVGDVDLFDGGEIRTLRAGA